MSNTMQNHLRRTKLKEKAKTLAGHLGVKEVEARIYLETWDDSDWVYQRFHITTTSIQFLHYFLDDKFVAFYKLSEEMEKYYAGDGDKIMFRDKSMFSNSITIKYEKLDKAASYSPRLKELSFLVKATLPATQGCLDCIYWRNKYKTCLYYRKMGMEIKKTCKDFRQKERNIRMSESDKENILQIRLEEIAERLGSSVNTLLEQYGNAQTVIEKFEKGELQLLNEEE